MDQATTRASLKALLFTPTDHGWGIPACFWGAPGVAKSAILRGVAEEHGLELQVLSPGLMGDGAFGAIPVPVGQGSACRITYPRPRWVERFEDDDGMPTRAGVVFVDELTTANPAMQAPLLGLIQERRIGFDYLGPRVRVFAAANPPEQAANGYDLSAPAANRMAHMEWPAPTSQEWKAHMMGRAVPVPGSATSHRVSDDRAAVIEKAVLDGWATVYAKVFGGVGAFISRKSDALHCLPASDDPSRSLAWPSHRTWDLAVSAVTTATILNESQVVQDALLSSLVGTKLAVEFAAFRRDMDLPDPEALLDGSAVFVPDSRRIDRTFAVLDSCVALVAPVSSKDRDRRAAALWGILDTLTASVPDLCANAVGSLQRAGLGANAASKLVVAAAVPVASRLGALVAAVKHAKGSK